MSAQDQLQPHVLHTNGTTIFAGGGGGGLVNIRSVDNGTTWQKSNIGFKSDVFTIYDYATLDNSVFAVTNKELYRSDDNGTTWQVSSQGLPVEKIRAVRAIKSVLIVGTSIGIYRSEDRGKTWQLSSGSELSITEQGLVILGESMCAGTMGKGVYTSDDAGKTWLPMNRGLEFLNPLTNKIEFQNSINRISNAN
jgi:ligand-binding sensor domain-containing protein